ncbi:MAG: response regulator transcription factor [Deltaproteobacteria bacterium]|nr:response regulator transcription factor [Deltaproteobacteria bacterium]
MVKILIADDHAVLRDGLKAIISTNSDWQVVAEASDGLEVLPLIDKFSPDILILDLAMPKLGGIEVINRLHKSSNAPRILVLSAKDDGYSSAEAMKAGANGFIPKKSSRDELEFAIKALMRGQTYLSPEVCSGVIQQNLMGNRISTPLDTLTDREREIMKLLCEGNPNREIANMLHISPRTIDTHRANILKKLNCHSNAELAQMAIKYGLIG